MGNVGQGTRAHKTIGNWAQPIGFAGYMKFLISRLLQPRVRVSPSSSSISRSTRSYFLERNCVSFPERYSKSEKGGGFDILCMRSPGVRGICANAPLRPALIRLVARARVFSSRRGVVINLLQKRKGYLIEVDWTGISYYSQCTLKCAYLWYFTLTLP